MMRPCVKPELKTYIFYETGSSCRIEFLMKDGEFHPIEDAVIIGIAEGKDATDALRNLKRESPYLKNYKFDRLAAREAGPAVYL